MGQYPLIRGAVLEHNAHEKHGIKPQADLFAHFGNPFCGIILTPLLFIAEIAES